MTTVSIEDEWDEIDECSVRKTGSNVVRKYSLNEKTQRFMSTFSKISIPRILRKSIPRQSKKDTPEIVNKRPVSLYCDNFDESPVNLSQYMQESTLLMALRDTEIKLLESEKHRLNLELKVKSMEKEVEYLQNENQQQIIKERALQSQIQEFERRNQTKEAECQEISLNARIREMELSSEIATLCQKISTIDTQKQERQIHKIMESQNRIMEQTLPYTMSTENIFDNEDGLFNTLMFEEVVKKQSKFLEQELLHPRRSSNESQDSLHFHDPNDYGSGSD